MLSQHLFQAAKTGDLDTVRDLVENNSTECDVNYIQQDGDKNMSVLGAAVCSNNLELVNYLLAMGAKIKVFIPNQPEAYVDALAVYAFLRKAKNIGIFKQLLTYAEHTPSDTCQPHSSLTGLMDLMVTVNEKKQTYNVLSDTQHFIYFFLEVLLRNDAYLLKLIEHHYVHFNLSNQEKMLIIFYLQHTLETKRQTETIGSQQQTIDALNMQITHLSKQLEDVQKVIQGRQKQYDEFIESDSIIRIFKR